MKPVATITKHNPETGLIGDCDRACLASLLELPSDSVPHFFDYPPEDGGDRGHAEKCKWLEAHGYTWADIPLQLETINDALSWAERYLPASLHYQVTAQSKNGSGHAVIAKRGEIVWDPTYHDDESGHGLVAPIDGVVWVGFLAKL